ncbi:MAG: 3-phosphoshikimate 1-carboxyvinyltransferase [Duodenibacillus sp.]|nr:3-phosphoshikimate 1-carboxyvinyltransferase [Duodenibacillus sp.]
MTAGRPAARRIEPVARASGTVRLPGSKSISNRALLLAALARGRTRLSGLLDADDTRRMIESLAALGIRIEREGEDAVVVEGAAGLFPVKRAELFIGNAGTAARTLTAALAFAGGEYRLDGVPRMRERPIGDLVDALRSLGASIDCELAEGYPPLAFHPARAAGGRVRVRGSVSSQFLTALLLVAPAIAPEGGLTIEIAGELISRPYIDMTVRMMRDFGAQVREQGGAFVVQPGVYAAPGDYAVEGDASGASYFLALGALAGGPVTVVGAGLGSIQGDVAFIEGLRMMGAQVEGDATSLTARAPASGRLAGLALDCSAIPDAAMTYVPMALAADGPVHLTGIASWRVKETDRLAAMAAEMRKLGAAVEEGPDWIRVCRGEPRPATVATYDDHRMAMSLALAAAAGGVAVDVLDPGCTSKTFPNFFDLFDALCRR